MPKFTKKPVDIEASIITNLMRLSTPNGRLIAKPGDVLINGISGDHYPCPRGVFLKSYVPAEGDNAARVMFDVLEKMEAETKASIEAKQVDVELKEVPRINSSQS